MTTREFKSILDELNSLRRDFSESTYLLCTMMELLNGGCLWNSKIEMSSTQRQMTLKSIGMLERRMRKTQKEILTRINKIDAETLKALVLLEE